MAENEEVVADGIDEVCSDECERYGADEVHALERAAKCEVEKQGYEAEGQGEHIGAGEDGDVGGDAQSIEEMWKRPDRGEEERRDGKAEIDAVDEGMEAVLVAAGSEGLGDKGVEADKKALAEEGKDKEEAGADADRGDGLGAVGEPADHHGGHGG